MEDTKENKNMSLYDKLREVPDRAKSEITEGRMKGKTNVNTQWRLERLTEIFGPCGFGWRTEIRRTWTEQADEKSVAAFCEINLFVKIDGQWSEPIVGTGGNVLIRKESSGYVYLNDEAYKMAYSDAISVAAKMLGLGADVYFGQDTNKYNAEAQLKRTGASAGQRQASSKTTPAARPDLNELSPKWGYFVTKTSKSSKPDEQIRKNIENEGYTITEENFRKLLKASGR